jgi:hypothetical protein
MSSQFLEKVPGLTHLPLWVIAGKDLFSSVCSFYRILHALKFPFGKVPTDYTNAENGVTLDLQLVNFEATKEPFKGSIIMNPGGPGMSGVEEIASKGPIYFDVFGGIIMSLDSMHGMSSLETLGSAFTNIRSGTGRTLPFGCLPVNTTDTTLTRRASNFTIPQVDV